MAPDDKAPWPAMGVGARGIVRDERGRVLLIKRSQAAGWDPGRWELPGGKGDYGETLQEALIREAREETGLAVEVGDPVHVGHFVKQPFWVTTVTFSCRLASQDARLSEEHEDLRWVEPEAVADLDCTTPTRDALDAYGRQISSPTSSR
jgi:8-oxo-dGTP diphosphatase